MKKIFLFLFMIFSFYISSVKCFALDKFYVGYHIDGLRYAKNKNGTIIYSDFKTIHKSGTDELSYCIQPGVMISTDDYVAYENYNEGLNITPEQMNKVKLISRYGYLYKNHTDIRWYVATQFMIWNTVKPENWDIYFVDENNNRLDNLFLNEIREINELILYHHDKPDILDTYEFNYNDDIVINDEFNMLEYYYPSSGIISGNKFVINEHILPGDYTYNLRLVNNKKPLFYDHITGQDLFTQGEIFSDNIKFKIHITAGKINIKECELEGFKETFIGGTYEILDQDSQVVDEITCQEGEKCLSDILPVGYYNIRVKHLNDDYEVNNEIYEVLVTDKNTSNASICSLKKDHNTLVINKSESTINTSILNNTVNNFLDEDYDYTVNNIFNYVVNNNVEIIKNYYSNIEYDNSIALSNIDEHTETNNNTDMVNNTNNSVNLKDEKNINNISNKLYDHNKCIHEVNNNNETKLSVKDTSKDSDSDNIKKTINVPNTSHNTYLYLVLSFIILFIYYKAYIKNESSI